MRLMLILWVIILGTGCLPPDGDPPVFNNTDYNMAERFFLEERYREAAGLLRSVVSETTHPRAYILRGKSLLHLGEYTEASEEFRQGSARAQVLDQHIEANLGLGDSYYAADQYSEAVEVYAMLINEFPRRIPLDIVKTRYSQCLIRLGRREKGKQAAKEVQAEFPGTPAAEAASELEFDADGEFYIQTGIFSKYSNASSLRARLAARGFEVEVVEKRGKYVVIIGYFQDVVQAQAELRKVKEAGFTKSFVKP